MTFRACHTTIEKNDKFMTTEKMYTNSEPNKLQMLRKLYDDVICKWQRCLVERRIILSRVVLCIEEVEQNLNVFFF